jgi:hypothetical protein
MSTNASNLLTISSTVIYSILWFYGVLTTAALLYFYQQFSATKQLMVNLKEEWESLQTAISNPLPISAPAVAKIPAFQPRLLTFDNRHRVMAMGRKGLAPSDIARACSMSEVEVDNLLRSASIQD